VGVWASIEGEVTEPRYGRFTEKVG
jgi:hypothetical protein